MTASRPLIIKNARLVLPDRIAEGDLCVEDGRIGEVGGIIDRQGADEIDATGLHVLPGVIDTHVHFREPGLTHKESIRTGSLAAAKGGVTAYLEMPNTKPPTTDPRRLDEKLGIAAETSYVDYGFYIGATVDNLEALKAAHRAAAIKIFVGSSTGGMLVDDQVTLERIFAETELPIAAHCEDEVTVRANAERLADETDPATHSRVRTPEAAARAVRRVTEMARQTGHRLHILHASTAAELEAAGLEAAGIDAAAAARRDSASTAGGDGGDGEGAERVEMAPARVTIEACYPHLFLDESDYAGLGNFAKVNPAIRSPEQRQALWSMLRAGRFQAVTSDHAPHTVEEKRQPYPRAPSGIPSVENGLALMLDAVNRGLVTLLQVVGWLCQGPATAFGIADKGRLVAGFDADLVLVDMARVEIVDNERQWTRAGWSPWHGRRLRGWPVRTLVGGRTVVRDGQLVAEPLGRALRFGHTRGQ